MIGRIRPRRILEKATVEMSIERDHAPLRAEPVRASDSRQRIDALDILRGAVMVLMVLDHTRDYFDDPTVNPTDLAQTTPALFMTRWVTHFCAPVFAFLAGTGTYLAAARGRPMGELSRFLVVRGLWLIFLELTIIRLGLFFDPLKAPVILTVLWSIGGSFIVLAGLLRVPSRVVGALGLVLIAGRGLAASALADSLAPQAIKACGTILFQPGLLSLGGVSVIVGYPLLPWLAIVALGYAFGEIVLLKPEARVKFAGLLGLAMIAAFIVMRWLNGFGDPSPWSRGKSALWTLLSFLNCTKQPPSVLFALMTLGPAITAFALIDRAGGRIPMGRILLTLGRVPLFYFILQWFVIHGLAVLASLARGFPVGRQFSPDVLGPPPEGWSLGLPGVYIAWVVALGVLYVPCRWFAKVKSSRPGGRLAYL